MRKIISSVKNLFVASPGSHIKKRVSTLLSRDNPVIIEAGAHVGTDSIEMARLWPQGIIHAFEPIPEIYNKLKRNTKKYRNISTYPVALSNQTGNAEIFVSSGNSDGSSSLLSPKAHLSEHPDVHFNTKIKIETITLDDWALKNNVSYIDFAWLDMQGFEFPVLKASEIVFSTIKAVYMEVSLKEMYEGVTLYPELKNWMEGRGFSVEDEDLHWKDMGNVLFVKG